MHQFSLYLTQSPQKTESVVFLRRQEVAPCKGIARASE